jgi:hypothetical protein
MTQWEREENDLWRDWQAGLRFEFPDPDLLAALVQAYMDHLNVWMLLLHRPTFEAAVADRLYERDKSFACVLLLVCAHGSRYIDDPRVCLPGTSQRSAGWPFYRSHSQLTTSSSVCSDPTAQASANRTYRPYSAAAALRGADVLSGRCVLGSQCAPSIVEADRNRHPDVSRNRYAT